jgi:hypothetical protein
MTFLNPLVLFGLASAAIPVILHLLNLRKLRTIEFSTLTFLKELQQTRIRRLKIRQLVLLLIRTLLILSLVFAFARPALKGGLFGAVGGGAKSTVVFILDDSFSMMASDQNGERFKQAKDKTEKLIDVLNEGDEIYLIKLSDLPRVTIDPATHDFNGVRSLVRESKVSDVRTPLELALKTASTLLARSKNANKEVYVISDMQRTLFESTPTNTSKDGTLFGSNIRLFLVNVGDKAADNVAVDSVEVLSKIVENDKPVEIYTSVRNFSSQQLSNYVVSAFIDNARAAQQTVRVDPWSSASVILTVTPKRTGMLKGYIELENDAIDPDNRRYFTVSVPERINATVVAANSTDPYFVSLALKSGDSNQGGSPIAVLQYTPQQFSLIDLNKVDVLVLFGAQGLPPNAGDVIKNFVSAGGGLVIFPGSQSKPDEFNNGLLSALSIPPVTGIVVGSGAGASVSFKSVDLDHPLFSSMFDHSKTPGAPATETVESPLITSALQRQSGREGHAVISLTDESPFLSEHRLGKGKILFYSVSPVLSWSDFPLKGIFVPLVYRSLMYAAAKDNVSQSFTVGQDIMVVAQSATNPNAAQFTLVSPDGAEERILPANSFGGNASLPAGITVRGGSLGFLKAHVALPGFYEVKEGSQTIAVASVNIDPRESDTRKISDADLEAVSKRWASNVKIVPSIEQTTQLQSDILQSRFGIELWKYLAALSLLLVIAEMAVARDSSKEISAAA